MPDWDEDSPQLRRNLESLLRQIRDEGRQRSALGVESLRGWHAAAMEKLDVPDQSAVGRFRGESGLKSVEVRIGAHLGVASVDVAEALDKFDAILKSVVAQLDLSIPPGADLNADQLAALLAVCGWAHAEWVRIHPFANGNGRTARLLANALAMRYGLPPFVRLRPRPDGGYGDASEAAMRGEWHPTVAVFRRMLNFALAE
jgi:hypothetical protein